MMEDVDGIKFICQENVFSWVKNSARRVNFWLVDRDLLVTPLVDPIALSDTCFILV